MSRQRGRGGAGPLEEDRTKRCPCRHLRCLACGRKQFCSKQVGPGRGRRGREGGEERGGERREGEGEEKKRERGEEERRGGGGEEKWRTVSWPGHLI